MANDFSSIIKDIISSTLETNLAKNTPISIVNTCNNELFSEKNIVVIESIFKFEKINSTLKFIYPANTASYISNALMMDETAEILDDIDEDMADALKEISAQISGAFVTSINAENYEELGTAEYTAGEVKIDAGENYKTTENLILLNIHTDNAKLEIYLDFNEETLPFIQILLQSDKKEFVSNEVANDKKDDSSQDDEDQNIEEESSTDTNTDTDTLNEESTNEDNIEEVPNIENVNLNENTDELDNENNVNKNKDKKLKLVIMVIASLLFIVIVIFLVLFFMGSFDEKEVVQNDMNKSKLTKKELLLSNIKNKEITYKSSLININKLNKRLAILTKYEILEEDILAKHKAQEKERLYKLKMSRLEDFALQNKEESLFKKDLDDVKNKNRFTDSNSTNENAKNIIDIKNTKLTLIQIDAINYKKYKDIIKEEKVNNTPISMCKSKDEKIKVYVGPLYLSVVINNIMNKIDKDDVSLITITQEEFDKRCDF